MIDKQACHLYPGVCACQKTCPWRWGLTCRIHQCGVIRRMSKGCCLSHPELCQQLSLPSAINPPPPAEAPSPNRYHGCAASAHPIPYPIITGLPTPAPLSERLSLSGLRPSKFYKPNLSSMPPLPHSRRFVWERLDDVDFTSSVLVEVTFLGKRRRMRFVSRWR